MPVNPPAGPPPDYHGTDPKHVSGPLPSQTQNPLSQYPEEDAYFPDLTMDMGSSLGYTQSIQYHSISIPQPSQPMPQLRQARLQQLREDRMRRQQRRMNPDATTTFRYT